MISSPDQFNDIAKLFLIKKKLVQKCNELSSLKSIVNEKATLYRYLSQMEHRRQLLLDRTRLPDSQRTNRSKSRQVSTTDEGKDSNEEGGTRGCNINREVSSLMTGNKKSTMFAHEHSSAVLDRMLVERTINVSGKQHEGVKLSWKHFDFLARSTTVTPAVKMESDRHSLLLWKARDDSIIHPTPSS